MGWIPDDLPRIDFNPMPPPMPVRQADTPFAPTDAGAASRTGEVQLQGQTRQIAEWPIPPGFVYPPTP